MTIKKKLEKVISNGASVVNDNNASKEWTTLSLRITKDTLNNVDQKVEKRLALSRTAWILEAIQEKLRNEMD